MFPHTRWTTTLRKDMLSSFLLFFFLSFFSLFTQYGTRKGMLAQKSSTMYLCDVTICIYISCTIQHRKIQQVKIKRVLKCVGKIVDRGGVSLVLYLFDDVNDNNDSWYLRKNLCAVEYHFQSVLKTKWSTKDTSKIRVIKAYKECKKHMTTTYWNNRTT